MNRYQEKLDLLWSFSKTGKKGQIVGISMIIVGCALFALIPLIAGLFIDGFMKKADDKIILDLDSLWVALIILAALIIIWYILESNGRAKLYRDMSSSMIRDRLVRKFEKLPADYFDRHSIGTLSSLITEDVPAVMKMATTYVPNLFAETAIIALIITLMCLSNVYLGLIYLVLSVLSLFITHKAGMSVHTHIRRRQASMAKMNGVFSDAMSNHSIIKAYRAENRAKRRFDRIEAEREITYVHTSNRSSYIEPFGRIIDNIGYIGSALIGVFLISEDLLTTGMFLSFISYATIIGRPIITLLDSMYQIEDKEVSLERISSVLDANELPDESSYDPIDMDSVQGVISFEDVSFGYNKDKMAVENVSFTANPDTMTVFVGLAGSGKSTISKLIMKYRVPDKGRILLDGRDISTIKRDDLRKIIGISSQTPWIFEGTIADNIAYGRENASLNEIINASKKTGFHDFVMRFPEGYDRIIGGDNGLSSGEAQLLSVTRLVLYDPKVVILDEATSDIDPITSLSMIENADEWMSGKTVFVVATDASAMVSADNIIYMKSGRIADAGTHPELIFRNQEYAEIFRSMTVG